MQTSGPPVTTGATHHDYQQYEQRGRNVVQRKHRPPGRPRSAAHLVGTLTCFVDQQFIAPRVLPSWIAGLRHFNEHSNETPEHRGPQRLAYLWLLVALIESPDALIEAMIEARSQLVAPDEALQPYATK